MPTMGRGELSRCATNAHPADSPSLDVVMTFIMPSSRSEYAVEPRVQWVWLSNEPSTARLRGDVDRRDGRVYCTGCYVFRSNLC